MYLNMLQNQVIYSSHSRSEQRLCPPLVSPESNLTEIPTQRPGKGVRAKHAHPCPKICALLILLFTSPVLASFHTTPDTGFWWITEDLTVWPTHMKIEITYSDSTTENFVAARGHDSYIYKIYHDSDSGGGGHYYLFFKDADVDDRWVMAAATDTLYSYGLYNDVFEYEDVVPWEAGYREALSNSFSLSEVRILDYWTDWTRLDVMWVPLFYGFLMGFMLDFFLHALGLGVDWILNPWHRALKKF